MHRTTLVLPAALKERAATAAYTAGLSFGEFVRRAIDRALEQKPQRRGRTRDPLFADNAVYRGKGPSDLAEHHDAYLYGE